VGTDVAGAQPVSDELPVGTLLSEVAEVDHHGQVDLLSGLQDAIYAGPVRMKIVSGLESDHRVCVLSCYGRGLVGIEVLGVLLDHVVDHAVAGNVDESEHAGTAAVDDRSTEQREVPSAGAPGVDHRGRAALEAEHVRRNAELSGPRMRVARRVEQMRVNVYRSCGNVTARNVDHLRRPVRLPGCRYVLYLPICDGHIADAVGAVLGVYDMPAL
jgi:hypothetical protein